MAYRALSTQEGQATGRRRYRQTWLGTIILQLEFEVIEHGVFQTWLDSFATVSRGESKVVGTYWRDATWVESGLNLWTVSSTFKNTCPQATVTDMWCPQTDLRRYRRSRFGKKVVLQVECAKKGRPRGTITLLTAYKLWRDAVASDVNLEEDGQRKILRIGMPEQEVIEYNDKEFKQEKD